MEIEESASEVTSNGMVFHLMTYSRDKVVESNALSLLSRPADCRMQVDDVSFELKSYTCSCRASSPAPASGQAPERAVNHPRNLCALRADATAAASS